MNKRVLLFLLSVSAMAAVAFAFVANGQPFYAATTNKPFAPVVRFAAFGDMGTGDDDQKNVARRMAIYHREHPFDTVLMLGDNIYPDGDPRDLLGKFERPYEELIRLGVNFYASLGNHDVKKGREAQINYPLFHMEGHNYYSFKKGDGLIEFFALDTTAFDSTQLRWLDGALAGSKAAWKIAFFHHPIYSSGKTHGSDVKLRGLIEPLFVKYGVGAVFSGHDHTYERTKPQQGVQYFVCGIGGKLRSGNLDRSGSLTAVGNDEVNGFMYVEATLERLSFQAIASSGSIIDSGEVLPRVMMRSAGSNTR